MSTVAEVVGAHGGDDPEALIKALVEREENMADLIRLAGTQFGLFPAIVTKVLMDVGLGEEKSPEVQEFINIQFNAALAELRAMIERHNNGEEGQQT